MKKRVLILGSTGFVGSNIINLIENDNYEIVPLERSKCDLLLPSSIEFLQNNIKI